MLPAIDEALRALPKKTGRAWFAPYVLQETTVAYADGINPQRVKRLDNAICREGGG